MADFWDDLNGDMQRSVAVPKAAPSGKLDARTLYNFYLQNGATKNEALMLTGAAHSESGFNPTAQHDKDANGNPTGYGMFGHRLERLTALQNYAGAQKPDWQHQALFALQEARKMPDVAGLLANAKGPEDLTKAQMFFEKPEGFSADNPTAGKNWSGRLGTISALSNGEFDKLPAGGTSGGMIQPAQAGDSDLDSAMGRRMIELFPTMAQQGVPSLTAAGNVTVPTKPPVMQGFTGLANQVGQGIVGKIPVPGTSQTLGDVARGVGGGLALAYNDFSRGIPLGQIAPYASDYYSKGNELASEASADYQKQAPAQAALGNLVGETAGATALGAGANELLKGAAMGAETLSPTLGSIARTGANWLGGTGGAGIVGKTISNALSGAFQGLVGTPVTGGDVAENILMGAGVNAGTNGLVRAVTSPLRMTARPEVAQAAEALRGYGIDVPGATMLPSPAAQKTVQALAGKNGAEPLEQLTNAVAGEFPMADMPGIMKQAGTGITPKVWQEARSNLGQQFESFAKSANIDLNAAGPKLYNDLQQIGSKAQSILDPTDSKKLRDAVQHVEDQLLDAHINGGQLSGDAYLQLTQRKHSVVQQLLDSPNGALKDAGIEIKDALDSALQQSSPDQAEAIAQARKEYRQLYQIKSVAENSPGRDTHGLLDPKLLSNAVKQDNSDLAKYGAAGGLLDRVNAAGAGKEAPGLLARIGGHGAGAGMTGAGLAIMGDRALEHIPVDEILPHLGDPLALGAMALAGGATLGTKHLVGNYLASPKFADQVIQNTLRPTSHYTVNPLVSLYNGARQ